MKSYYLKNIWKKRNDKKEKKKLELCTSGWKCIKKNEMQWIKNPFWLLKYLFQIIWIKLILKIFGWIELSEFSIKRIRMDENLSFMQDHVEDAKIKTV